LMEFDLGFVKAIKHSESLLEAIFHEGVEVDESVAAEANAFCDKIMTQPYGVLVNLANDFSVDFTGSLNIGNSPLEKRVAILTFRPASKIAMTTVIQSQKKSFPDKELRFFDDREEALSWLEELPSD
ncbi:MAG: hypothetical protein OQK78_07125, partial [Gammaproteobacteria bacterium]|nr:hypothetical protein [Gammaproteobacteria bacterium]